MRTHWKSDAEILTLFSGVQYVHETDIDTITWINKDVPKNIHVILTLSVGWLVWVAATGYFAYGLFTVGIGEKPLIEQIAIVVMFILLLLCSFFFPISFLSLTQRQTLTISNNDFCLSYSGILAPKKKCFTKEVVLGLYFQRYQGHDGTGFLPSLAIKYKKSVGGISGMDREHLAHWMRTKEKRQLFLFLRKTLMARGWNIEYQPNN